MANELKLSCNDVKTLIRVQTRLSRLYRNGSDSEELRNIYSCICASIEEMFEQIIRENESNLE